MRFSFLSPFSVGSTLKENNFLLGKFAPKGEFIPFWKVFVAQASKEEVVFLYKNGEKTWRCTSTCNLKAKCQENHKSVNFYCSNKTYKEKYTAKTATKNLLHSNLYQFI